MPLYEILTIARSYAKLADLRDLLKKQAFIVLDNKGVVRKIENLGVQNLPYPMKAHTDSFVSGHYFLMKFDARPQVMNELNRLLKVDDRIIRYTILRRPDTEQLAAKKDVTAKEWIPYVNEPPAFDTMSPSEYWNRMYTKAGIKPPTT